MKKFILSFVMIFVVLISSPAKAAGIYDGIWQASFSGETIYFSIYEADNGTLVIFSLDANDPETDTQGEALIGPLTGTSAQVTTVQLANTSEIIVLDLAFTSTRSGSFTLVSCTEIATGLSCDEEEGPPIGVAFPLTKIL